MRMIIYVVTHKTKQYLRRAPIKENVYLFDKNNPPETKCFSRMTNRKSKRWITNKPYLSVFLQCLMANNDCLSVFLIKAETVCKLWIIKFYFGTDTF